MDFKSKPIWKSTISNYGHYKIIYTYHPCILGILIIIVNYISVLLDYCYIKISTNLLKGISFPYFKSVFIFRLPTSFKILKSVTKIYIYLRLKIHSYDISSRRIIKIKFQNNSVYAFKMFQSTSWFIML